jgi:ATP citrate (pro-S)-lyase
LLSAIYESQWPSYPRARPATKSCNRAGDAKQLLGYWLERAPAYSKDVQVSSNFKVPFPKVAQVRLRFEGSVDRGGIFDGQISWDAETGTITPDSQLPPWVFTSKLVVKPCVASAFC